MADQIMPKPAPVLDIPQGQKTCLLAAIDTTCYLTVPGDTLVEPPIPGHELMNFPTMAFLIKHPSGKYVLFDLGCRKDFWNLPSPIATVIDAKVPGIKVEKNLVDILTKGGIDIANLQAAIISHHHYDHMGDPATFPKSMGLVVGPGFSDHFLPGYPTNENSPVFENAFEGRNIHEVVFSDLEIAGYRAFDYFSDGSLYILDTPGHAIGHLSILVRTTNDTFVFLGGDICHFGGTFRPTKYVPLPEQLSASDLDPYDRSAAPYACSLFTACHPSPENARTMPYYKPCSSADSWYVDPGSALKSVENLANLDANDRILILIAHDPAAMKVLSFFPNGNLNDWYGAGWKQKLRWGFLDELPMSGRKRKYLVDGTYINGVCVKNLDGTRNN